MKSTVENHAQSFLQMVAEAFQEEDTIEEFKQWQMAKRKDFKDEYKKY